MDNFTILTFNISEVNSNFGKIDKEQLLENLTEILQPKLDNIYFISSQEDEIYSKFLYYIKKIFNSNDYFFYESTYISPFAKIIGNNYNIHSLVIIPHIIKEINNIKIETIKKINHNTGYTKGSIILKISNSDTDIYLISSHLPMSNKTIDLGYNKREKSVIDVLKYISTIMNNKKLNYLLWTGDLNFRKIRENNKDQLIELLIPRIYSKYLVELQDLSQIKKNQPSCKTVIKEDKINCDELCYTKKGCNSCYDIQTKKGLRIPSYCDRVLGWSNVGEFVSYNTTSLNAKDFPFIKFSDHNPIISRVVLPRPDEYYEDKDDNYFEDENTNLVGGNFYINKLDKYMQKYNYLLNN